MPDSLLPPPRNPVTPTLDQLVSAAATARDVGHAAVVQPVQEMAHGLSDLASGYGVTPEVGAGAFAAMGLLSPMKAGVLTKGIRAYHGSPYKFDKFSLDKIGTGEGAQAYGHGLYFADNEAVARSYRDKLAPKTTDESLAMQLSDSLGRSWSDLSQYEKTQLIDEVRKNPQISAQLGSNAGRLGTGGHMYEVNINARPEQFLDWDKPLGQQPHIAEAIKGLANKIDVGWMPTFRNELQGLRKDMLLRAETGQDAYSALSRGMSISEKGIDRGNASGQARAADALREAGIPGIRYLDQGSRDAGQGSYNYVINDDKLIDILKRYGIAGLGLSGLTAASQGDWNYQQKAPQLAQ